MTRPPTAHLFRLCPVTAFTLLTLYIAPAPAQPPPASPATQPTPPPAPIVDADTEQVIAAALRYLASRQAPSGAWSLPQEAHQAAITAYVLNAFFAAGHLPDEGPHGATVRRGLDFLITCVRPDGYIAAGSGQHNMYGHGIATIVLGEAYGMTTPTTPPRHTAPPRPGSLSLPGPRPSAGDTRIRPALERAVRLIIATQNNEGGWRYQPRQMDADISVTVLQATALRVAKNSGFDVPQPTLDRAAAYVRACFIESSGGFSYQSGGSQPGFARTCAAIYTLQVLGDYDDPRIARGSRFAFEQYPLKDVEWFTYGNFYAAPAHYMIGGDTWARWYTMAHTRLMTTVRRDGDRAWWPPLEGPASYDEVFATAVYATVLAMPYQYLPLYQR